MEIECETILQAIKPYHYVNDVLPTQTMTKLILLLQLSPFIIIYNMIKFDSTKMHNENYREISSFL